MKYVPAYKCRACGSIVLHEKILTDSVEMDKFMRDQMKLVASVHACDSPEGFLGLCDHIGFQPKVG